MEVKGGKVWAEGVLRNKDVYIVRVKGKGFLVRFGLWVFSSEENIEGS